MKNILLQKQWGWKTSGAALALAFLLATILVKPIGVSTQFVIVDGLIWNAISSTIVKEDASAKKGYSSPNAYLNKSGGKYAKSVANPRNYSFIFVLAMVLGGLIAAQLQTNRPKRAVMPEVWKDRFGAAPWKRYLAVFIAGFLTLIGARLAGGCTSGHMMSGMMQTSLSGYLFALGAFAAAVPTALLLFKKGKNK